MRLLWAQLPRLESIVHESCLVSRRMWKATYDRELASAIEDSLPSHVRTLSFFEDLDDNLASVLPHDKPIPNINTSRNASLTLVEAVSSRSRGLERLSISYLIDAQQFFSACQSTYTWHRLRSLILTASILTQTALGEEIYTFLQNVGLVASNMPELEIIILWNGRRGEACAVIYYRSRGSRLAALTWRGTFDLDFSPEVVEAWRKVASEPSNLLVKNERIQGPIESHGDAIQRLCLPDGVIGPVSLWQIQQECMK
ncbi:hypothetical protein BJX70DRAFT_326951 [Aspergillus crustosus]